MTTEYDVIVIGAGVVGPAIATALARQGRKVLIVERSWAKPDRIVGELLQPGGLKALKELGMAEAVSNIEAIHVEGYCIKFNDDYIALTYPERSEIDAANPVRPVPGCVAGGNDKLALDSTLSMADWERDSRVRGVAFHHGDFLMNLRAIVRREANVTALEGTVTRLLREGDAVVGVEVKTALRPQHIKAALVVACDGIYSKFRKELPHHVPHVGLYFVGLHLKDARLPMPHFGHVVLGDHAPVIIYQIAPHDTRILCAYRSTTPPRHTDLEAYLRREVLPALPQETQPAFAHALATAKLRVMPNQYLPAKRQLQNGLVVLGDALNMRHPLTGGGMTVGLSDAALLARLLQPSCVPALNDHRVVSQQLRVFYTRRKGLDAVINTLSIALYSLFAADRNSLKILQKGCFRYFHLGGACATGPMGLLSGMLPFPMLLFNHFFSVAFYAIYCNFAERGVLGFLVALFEAVETLITAIVIFGPYLWKEMM